MLQNEINLPNQDSTTPNYRTKKRFEEFEKLKKAHPDWTQPRVALEASDVLHEILTEDTVRNAYRLMGQKWKRGDRTR